MSENQDQIKSLENIKLYFNGLLNLFPIRDLDDIAKLQNNYETYKQLSNIPNDFKLNRHINVNMLPVMAMIDILQRLSQLLVNHNDINIELILDPLDYTTFTQDVIRQNLCTSPDILVTNNIITQDQLDNLNIVNSITIINQNLKTIDQLLNT